MMWRRPLVRAARPVGFLSIYIYIYGGGEGALVGHSCFSLPPIFLCEQRETSARPISLPSLPLCHNVVNAKKKKKNFQPVELAVFDARDLPSPPTRARLACVLPSAKVPDCQAFKFSEIRIRPLIHRPELETPRPAWIFCQPTSSHPQAPVAFGFRRPIDPDRAL
ncbi:hypothetical protein ACQKWADRAFT_242184 [Trichoderma austrokoningii]